MLLPETGRLISVWHTSTHAHAPPAVITYLHALATGRIYCRGVNTIGFTPGYIVDLENINAT